MKSDQERFYKRVKVTAPDECWEWQSYRGPQGYGVFSRKILGQTLAHRISFVMNCGPLTEEICVLHKCDNPPCVNPKHLFLGNRDMNNKDRAQKGRTVIWNSLKTHCKNGHEFTKENIYYRSNGSRYCRECGRIASRKVNAEKSAGLR